MNETQDCPCSSGRPYAECCEPYLNGSAGVPTAAALMRSRYTAYTLQDISYLERTLHPGERGDFDAASAAKWAREAKWERLEIVDTSGGETGDNRGTVEFKAYYKRHGSPCVHHELAEFRKADGTWYFFDGKMVGSGQVRRTQPKIGRNDPCPCGSGKKFKKCCMNAV